MNIGPMLPPVSTPKINKQSRDAAVAGTEITDNPQHIPQDYRRQKRRQNDRRKKNIKPLLDLRVTRDRREDPNIPRIDIEI